jgi:hypothetical protein
MQLSIPHLVLCLASFSLPALAQTAGSFHLVGSTLVSAMMVSFLFHAVKVSSFFNETRQMFLGNEQKVYILDKTEGNAAQINGHSAWGSVW